MKQYITGLLFGISLTVGTLFLMGNKSINANKVDMVFSSVTPGGAVYMLDRNTGDTYFLLKDKRTKQVTK